MNDPDLIFSAGPPERGPTEKIIARGRSVPVAEAAGRVLSPLRGFRKLDVLLGVAAHKVEQPQRVSTLVDQRKSPRLSPR